MALTLRKFLDDHYIWIIFPVIIGLLTLWAFVDFAEGEYCAASCQKLKEQQNDPKVEVKKTEPIKTTTSTIKKTTAEPCYGIFCNDKLKQSSSKVNYLKYPSQNFISIIISDSCKDLDYCPTIKEIADMYDNSNKYLSGNFKIDNKTGKWYREPPKVPKMFEFYRYTDLPWIVWVSPDDYTWDRSKHIIIEPHLRYKSIGKIDESRMMYEFEGLSLNGCDSAVIGWKNNGSDILLDVMNHFYSNCKESIVTDNRIEIFLGSKIFEDCDQECFYLKSKFKTEVKADVLAYAETHNDKKDDDKSKEPTCYGIYCKKDKVDENAGKTEKEIRDKRLKELLDIKECKEYQAWDEEKAGGKYRRLNYDCNDKAERNAYLKIMRPVEKQVETNSTNTNSTKTYPKRDTACYGIHCD